MNSRDQLKENDRFNLINNRISIIINILKFFVYERLELKTRSEIEILLKFIKISEASLIFNLNDAQNQNQNILIDYNDQNSNREKQFAVFSTFHDRVSKNRDIIKKPFVLTFKMVDNDQLETFGKGYIRFNISFYAAFVLIVKKPDKRWRLYIDYRVFNAFIILNRNALSLIKKTLVKFCAAKIYNKFDIITVFNEIRVWKNYKEKIIFFIKYDLYEYIIMPFNLCNASITF